MNSFGIEVLRFTNDEIRNDISKVINTIERKCECFQAQAPPRP